MIRQHMTGAAREWRRGEHLVPYAAVPNPRVGIPHQNTLVMRSAEKHNLAAYGVERHAVLGACRGTFRTGHLSPVDAVPGPGVVGVARVSRPAEQHHFPGNSV